MVNQDLNIKMNEDKIRNLILGYIKDVITISLHLIQSLEISGQE